MKKPESVRIVDVRVSPDADRADVDRAMLRYANGDERAFADVYATLAPQLRRICMRLAGHNDAADLMQEVFLKLHRVRATFDTTRNVRGWAFAIARTTHLDQLRHRTRRRENLTAHGELEPLCQQHGDPFHLADVASHDIEKLLSTCLAGMSEAQQSALVLVKLTGLSCEATATRLGASTSAIRQRVVRASERLRSQLTESA